MRPIVRSRGHLILTIDLTAEDPHGDLADLGVAYYVSQGRGGASLDFRAGMGARLVDLERDLVASVALDGDADGMLLSSYESRAETDEQQQVSGMIQLVYGDLGADELAVYLPTARLVTGVPVVDGEPPSSRGSIRSWTRPSQRRRCRR
ncbi:hypothetical protein ACT3TZ_03145 [Brachybacterium sp. AOP25-B2-12]|uniref:hypothetical protein n=1 Tax=Brachybacterium sp. AOP25-B2-12 TaxID=3457710 RepID=UPI0040335FE8